MSSILNATLEELHAAFEEFKNIQNERLKKVEERTAEKKNIDTEMEQKLAHLTQTLEEACLRLQKSTAANGRPLMAAERENFETRYHQAFLDYLRYGHEGELRLHEKKAWDGLSPETGACFFPKPMVDTFEESLESACPLLGVCRRVQTSLPDYTFVRLATPLKTRWLDPQQPPSLDEDKTSELRCLTARAQTLSTNLYIANSVLEDSSFDLMRFIHEESVKAFGAQLTHAFLFGRKTYEPEGILEFHGIHQNAIAQHKRSAIAISDLNLDDEQDSIVDTFMRMVYSLPNAYMQNLHFAVPRQAVHALMKLQAPEGGYFWKMPETATAPRPTFLGIPVLIIDHADMDQIIYGNFERGYSVIQRAPITVKPNLRLSNYTCLTAHMRLTGMVTDENSLRLMNLKHTQTHMKKTLNDD